MRSLLTKLLILLVGLVGLMLYQQRDRIESWSPSALTALIPDKVKQAATDRVTTTTVYKWRDEQGRLHVSDTPPKDGKVVTVQEYRSDQNVIPGRPRQVPAPSVQNKTAQQSSPRPAGLTGHGAASNPGEPGSTGFGANGNALERARASRQALEQRNQRVQEQLNR